MNSRTRDEHLFGPGPKRILCLDGGGIRGALSLGFLERIESLLRERAGGDPEFRLSDYFDLIGGTSTGSIIAAGLALGFSVAKLQQLYQSLAEEVFKKPLWRFGVFTSKFPIEPLVAALDQNFGQVTIGGDEVRTGLMIVTKRLDTGSPWVIHNNPRGKYFDSDGAWIPNRDYLLREVVRASAAAPHYFEPEGIQVAADVEGAFVDGGVSPFNNPSLQALMLATLSGYGLNWPFGEDRLLLVSVGTGTGDRPLDPKDVLKMPALQLAGQSVLSIMADCDALGQTMLQWMSRSPTAWPIDSEVEDLRGDVLGGGAALLSYLRYNVKCENRWLRTYSNFDISQVEANSLCAVDQRGNVGLLNRRGATAGQSQVKAEHFPPAFDVS